MYISKCTAAADEEKLSHLTICTLSHTHIHVYVHNQVKCPPAPPSPLHVNDKEYLQQIADRVAKNLEIISKTFSTNQTSAHGIHD